MHTKIALGRLNTVVGAFCFLSFAGGIGPAGLAQSVVVQLGEQDFTNGQGVGFSDYNAAAAGEPVPFNTFRGSDLAGEPPFSASWTFNYPARAYTSAVLTLGIQDGDSQAPGNQVAFFGVDGNNLTSLLNAQLESTGGRQAEYNVYSVSFSALNLSNLVDGSATFTLTLQGPSLGGSPLTPVPESLPSNGAGIDFARLNLVVPEPTGLALLILAITSLAAARRI